MSFVGFAPQPAHREVDHFPLGGVKRRPDVGGAFSAANGSDLEPFSQCKVPTLPMSPSAIIVGAARALTLRAPKMHSLVGSRLIDLLVFGINVSMQLDSVLDLISQFLRFGPNKVVVP